MLKQLEHEENRLIVMGMYRNVKWKRTEHPAFGGAMSVLSVERPYRDFVLPGMHCHMTPCGFGHLNKLSGSRI